MECQCVRFWRRADACDCGGRLTKRAINWRAPRATNRRHHEISAAKIRVDIADSTPREEVR
eukprot:scaffold930_cov126-Skeletonema_dohrnii-CCMP3373.AAC.10